MVQLCRSGQPTCSRTPGFVTADPGGRSHEGSSDGRIHGWRVHTSRPAHRTIGRTLSRDMESQSAWTPLIGFRPFELQVTQYLPESERPMEGHGSSQAD